MQLFNYVTMHFTYFGLIVLHTQMTFLDTQVSLAPAYVRWLVGWSHFRIGRPKLVGCLQLTSMN